MSSAHGTYVEEACGGALEYDAEVVDLNGDGRPEVFTSVHGICLGGAAGVLVELYVQDAGGAWQPQLGFPGTYTVLAARSGGFPDIEIGGPGDCFPVWRWNGQRYAVQNGCSR